MLHGKNKKKQMLLGFFLYCSVWYLFVAFADDEPGVDEPEVSNAHFIKLCM